MVLAVLAGLFDCSSALSPSHSAGDLRRQFMKLRLLALILLSSCIRLPSTADDGAHADGARAFVSADSAEFVFPVPADGWAPVAKRGSDAPAPAAYTWQALWDASDRRPAEYRAHAVTLSHGQAPASGERLRDWAAAAVLRGGIASECGDMACMIAQADAALSATVRTGAVVLKLAPSARLTALNALHPDSAVLEFYVRAPAAGAVSKAYQRVVAVTYP
jgi:hypothetical protein